MSYILMIWVTVAATPIGPQKDYSYAGTYQTESACIKGARALNKEIYKCLPTGDVK